LKQYEISHKKKLVADRQNQDFAGKQMEALKKELDFQKDQRAQMGIKIHQIE
jgi:hypothetical protein